MEGVVGEHTIEHMRFNATAIDHFQVFVERWT